MLSKVKITNCKKTPYRYLGDVFKDGTEFDFTNGVNIIIGANGSGKSTLLNIIKAYTFCHRGMKSEIPNAPYMYPELWDMNDNLLDGVEVFHDYENSVFSLLPKNDMKGEENQEGIRNFSIYLNSINASVGEQTLVAVNSLFEYLFDSKTDRDFVLNHIKELYKKCNDKWKKRFGDLIAYYERHSVKGEKVTLLMDEPDRNLDIDNIEEVFKMLSYNHPQVQMVAVVHNPVLIYRLSKIQGLHMMETTEGYLRKVINFVEGNG